MLAGLLAAPQVSFAECVQQMSRIPMAAPAPAKAPAYRANMARTRPVAGPAAKPARPRAIKTATVHKQRVVRKAAIHRPVRKKPAVVRRVAVAAPVARIYPTPTPMPVAQRELSTPLAYALIDTTVCVTGPGVLDAAPPRLAMARLDEPPTAGAIPEDGTGFPFPDGSGLPGTGFPGTGFPGGGVSPGGPGTTPLPPIVTPPITEPPITEPPIVLPPGEPPPVVPPGVEPPVGPPGGEPPVIGPPPGPPVEPPIITPPVITPVPEPGTWALLILGFGLIGARLRATSSAGSGSRGRAARRG